MKVITAKEADDLADKLQNCQNDTLFFLRTSAVFPMQYRVVVNMRADSVHVLILHLLKANPALRDVIVSALKKS